MKHGMPWVGLGIWALFISPWGLAEQGKVAKLDLRPGKARSTLLVTYSGAGKFRMFQSEQQGSVIIEAENLSLPPALTRLVDVSGGGGPVLRMTPYNSQHSGRPMVKLVLQLRSKAEVITTDMPGKFLVEIAGRGTGLPSPVTAASDTGSDELKARQSASKKSEEVAKRLIDVLSSPHEEKKYFGSKVTFEGKDVDVPDIFRLVGESSDLNIIWDSDVDGQKTNIDVRDLPWDQLLDIVIQQKNFRAAVMGNVVRIMSVDTFNRQAEAKKRELSLSEELEPVVMSVIPMGFTQATDMKKVVEDLMQDKGVAVPGSAALGQDFKRGRIQVDERTNSMIVTNTKETVERIRRLVKELDIAVPQVLIDAKVVIARDTFTRNVGMSWKYKAVGTGGASGALGAFNGQAVALSGSPPTPDAFSISSASEPIDGSLGFGFGTTGTAQLQAQLKLAELSGQAKTVASPRVVVNNNQKADITDGQTVTIANTVGQGGTSTFKDITANLSLSVKPQVTSHGSIQLKELTVTKDSVSAVSGANPTVDNKRLATDVLVDSGSTLVLGGVYQLDQSSNIDGIPVLKDLPFIGALFRSSRERKDKSELMVFITPQILDPESASQAL